MPSFSNCWLRHSWAKWEQYEIRFPVPYNPIAEMIKVAGARELKATTNLPGTIDRNQLREKRTCESCGAMQDRLVRDS